MDTTLLDIYKTKAMVLCCNLTILSVQCLD